MIAAALLCLAAAASAPPGFTLTVEPPEAPQGSIVVVRARPLDGHAPRDLSVTWKDVVVQGFAWTGGDRVALVPVKLEQKTGPHEIAVHVVDGHGAAHDARVTLSVVAGDFDTDVLSVKKSFTEPTRAQRDRAKQDSDTFDALWKELDRDRRWRGAFLLPARNVTTAKFGTYRTLNGKVRSRHMGLDVRGRRGDPIFAANDARVALVRDCFYSGNTIVLDHGDGLVTLYFHATTVQVKPGQLVKRGQRIATIGDTGRVTGPHLHWSVKIANVYVDPARLLAMDLDDDPLRPSKARARAVPDAGVPDAAVVEGPAVDAGPSEAGPPDAGTGECAPPAGDDDVLRMSVPEESLP